MLLLRCAPPLLLHRPCCSVRAACRRAPRARLPACSPARAGGRLAPRQMASAAAGEGEGAPARRKDPLVQYVVVRRDLKDAQGAAWPLGAVVAQGAHASVAAVAEALREGDAAAHEYVAPDNLGAMTKVRGRVRGVRWAEGGWAGARAQGVLEGSAPPAFQRDASPSLPPFWQGCRRWPRRVFLPRAL